jgi:hypothetical protein
MSCPTPLYDPSTASGAFALRYTWTGWQAAGGSVAPHVAQLIDELTPEWEWDGLRVLEHRTQDDQLQVLFCTTPEVSPERLAARAKGRLDYLSRKTGTPLSFTRKVAVRSIGENTRTAVETYVGSQVAKAEYADPRWEAAMQELVLKDAAVDLSAPRESASRGLGTFLH